RAGVPVDAHPHVAERVDLADFALAWLPVHILGPAQKEPGAVLGLPHDAGIANFQLGLAEPQRRGPAGMLAARARERLLLELVPAGPCRARRGDGADERCQRIGCRWR